MPKIEITEHLHRYCPKLTTQETYVPAGSVAHIIHAINQLHPGLQGYILDDNGALRRHVKISINNTLVVDRKNLTDHVQDNDTVFIFQALTGG